MAIYTDSVFRVRDLDEAKRIILTTERGLDTETRWATETPYLAQRMRQCFADTDLLLDFGCGVGRLAKAWLDQCPQGFVHGCDLSLEMRQLGPAYVDSPRFAVSPPEQLQKLLDSGLRFDGAVASWIIQHVFDAQAEINRLHSALKPGGKLLVINNLHRAVPTSDKGWVSDGFDVAAALAQRFEVLEYGQMPESATSAYIAQNTFIAVYRRKD